MLHYYIVFVVRTIFNYSSSNNENMSQIHISKMEIQHYKIKRRSDSIMVLYRIV